MSKYDDLRVENDEQEKHLFYKNLNLLREMKLYLRSKNIHDSEFEDTRRDLIEMALEAQLRGESFEKTLGRDPKEFCDELVGYSDKKSRRERINDYIQGVIAVLILTGTINIIVSTMDFKGDIRDLRFPVTLGFLSATAMIIIIGGLIMSGLRRYAFERGKENLLSIGIMITIIAAGYLWFIFRDNLIFQVDYKNLMWIVPLICAVILISRKRKEV